MAAWVAHAEDGEEGGGPGTCCYDDVVRPEGFGDGAGLVSNSFDLVACGGVNKLGDFRVCAEGHACFSRFIAYSLREEEWIDLR